MTVQANPAQHSAANIGFVNRRSGFRLPHPAPTLSATSKWLLAEATREIREMPPDLLAHKSAQSHSTCCMGLMLSFFATLNRDPQALSQAHEAARLCEAGV